LLADLDRHGLSSGTMAENAAPADIRHDGSMARPAAGAPSGPTGQPLERQRDRVLVSRRLGR